jgi:hypothetical protein
MRGVAHTACDAVDDAVDDAVGKASGNASGQGCMLASDGEEDEDGLPRMAVAVAREVDLFT